MIFSLPGKSEIRNIFNSANGISIRRIVMLTSLEIHILKFNIYPNRGVNMVSFI
ncbi:hypothetical protein BA6E_102293 [Bacteroidales bacterium 6E]|nr:hypothetical protein BA6E_102293 [Bacteroidales bacterium 6E]